MIDSLETKRAEVAEKLAALRVAPEIAELVSQADQAMSALKAEVAAYESQLGEIEAQVGARERVRREAVAQQREQDWRDRRKELLEEEEHRLQAIGDAQASSRALVDAFNRLFASNDKMRKLAQLLTVNGRVPASLSQQELENRMAARLASTLATIVGRRNRLGTLEWPSGATGLYPPNRSWRDDEEAMAAKQVLQPLLEKGKA